MNEARRFVIAIVRRPPLFLNFLIEGLSQLFDNVTNVLRSCMNPLLRYVNKIRSNAKFYLLLQT